ncbi:MAG: metallophosphoesterase family protein [Pirellulaceae bacterium]
MKLGLITDVHEHVENLRAALAHLAEQRVDQIVIIGDVVEMGQRLEETCRLLADAGVVGVWGNHDFGLCHEPTAELCARHSPTVLGYMGTLQPRLVIDGCHFSHVEPWLNPLEILDLWYFEGLPSEHGNLSRLFAATSHRLMFAGHFHHWEIATPERVLDWHGEVPITLDSGRYFVAVGALCEGEYAVIDTESSLLTPLKLKSGVV